MTKKPEIKLTEAIEKHQHGFWQEAEKLYQHFLAENPDNADVLHLLGILYGQQEDYKNAEDYLTKALNLAPNNATFHNSMANVKKHLSDIQGAIDHYQQAISIHPNSSIALNNLALLFIQENKLTEAKELAEKALALSPQDAESHYNFALVSIKLNNTNLAIEELRNTLELNANHHQAQYTLAQLLQNANQSHLDEAIKLYQNILEAQPRFTDAWANYASALLVQNKIKKAIDIFYRVLEMDSDHYEAHYNLGCILLTKHQLKPALEHFLKALYKKPTPETYYNIGMIYSYQDHHGDAITYLKKAIDINANYFAALNNLGTVYLKIEDIPKAIENFQAALNLQPDNQEIAYILAALKQENTPEQAPKEYIEHLFDQYAPHFDQHLTEHLKYATPKLLHDAVMNEINDDLHLRPVLDLGCGTGLAGLLFKDIASPLIGVDLSREMIALLEKKAIYDELIVGDLYDTLEKHRDNQIIIAADVLPYFGDLSKLFHHVSQALSAKGLFGFTIEKATSDISTYSLQTSIRYAHSPEYIKTLAAKNNLNILTENEITLRLQRNKPLRGLLFVLAR